MTASRNSRRRFAAITGAKILITSAALAATLGGWALLSSGEAAAPASAAAQPRAANGSAATPAPRFSPGQSDQSQGTQPFRPRRNRQVPGVFPDPNGGSGNFFSPFSPSFRSRSSR